MSHDEENTFEDDTLSLLEPRGLLDAVLGDKGVNFSYIPEVLQEDDRIAWAQSLLGAASIWTVGRNRSSSAGAVGWTQRARKMACSMDGLLSSEPTGVARQSSMAPTCGRLPSGGSGPS